MKFYRCDHCGNIITFVHSAGVPVMCCGQKMTELVPGTTDAAVEKHVPVTAVEGNLRQLFGLWLPNLAYSFGALGLMAAAAKRLRPSYTAYFLAYFVVAIGATWLLSAPRYLAACFPLALALAALADTRRKDALATFLSLAGLVAYLAMYVNGYPVY